jgi:AcrR family transcriptional regulator
MAQYLKDEIEHDLLRTALEVFAERGYAAATIAEIAQRSGISTGNVYRYFPNKAELFAACVPEDVSRKFTSLLRRRVEALDGVADVRSLAATSTYYLVSEELLSFSIQNRLRIVILLGRGENTPYAGFAEQTVQELVRLALAYEKSISREPQHSAGSRFVLEQIYRNFVTTTVAILLRFKEETAIRDAIYRFSSYHLPGLGGFFAGEHRK